MMKARLLAALLVLPFMLTPFLSAFAETRFSFPSESEIIGVFSLPDEKFGILGIENNTYTITSIDEYGHIDIINTDINCNDASYSCFEGSFYFYESLCEAHDAPFYYVSVSVFDPGQDLPASFEEGAVRDLPVSAGPLRINMSYIVKGNYLAGNPLFYVYLESDDATTSSSSITIRIRKYRQPSWRIRS